MDHLGVALETLRPLILAANAWDYCVVWELDNDEASTSSSIHLVACCCSGGGGEGIGGKVRMLCRDVFIPHPANTVACDALANLPSSMPLPSSGIHWEVVKSNQPRWLHHIVHMANPKGLDESITTQVLIPVLGGLVELFSAKNLSKDEEMVEYLMAQFNNSWQRNIVASENFMETSLNLQTLGSFLTQFTTSWLPSFTQMNVIPLPQTNLPIGYFSSNVNFEGAATVSIPLDEQSSSALGPPSLHQYTGPDMAKLSEDVQLSCGKNLVTGKERFSVGLRPNKERYRSKNLLPERNRRTRIREGILELRALVPKITKMDIAATLGDAINYIHELEGKVKELRDELEDFSENIDCDGSTLHQKASKLERRFSNEDNVVTSRQTQASSCNNEKKLVEAHVEVNKLGTRDFLLKVLWEHKRGCFTRLIEALAALGLEVTDANVTSCKGVTLNIVRVQASSNEIVAKKLKDALNRLASS